MNEKYHWTAYTKLELGNQTMASFPLPDAFQQQKVLVVHFKGVKTANNV
jgi:hypothetical protein